MNYSALIENRKSVRAFTDKKVSPALLGEIRKYYREGGKRLLPELQTDLVVLGSDAREALEGAAGYNEFLVGAPQYLVLLTDKHELAELNAGYLMEDLVLKLTDLELSSCFVTFTDSERIKNAMGIRSALDVAAIVAFGYGVRTTKRLRLNILSMSNVDVVAKHRYMEPKRRVQDMAFLDRWGNSYNLDRYIGFFDDMLWEALYAASLAPSYLNRQAYGFLLRDGMIHLVSRPDLYNNKIDGDLSLGIVLLHFSAVAETWSGQRKGEFASREVLALPEGHSLVASSRL